MLVRKAREEIEAAIRRLLGVRDGDSPAYVPSRLSLRSRDALAVLEVAGRVLTLRLAPHGRDRRAAERAHATRNFLLFRQPGADTVREASPAYFAPLVERLRARDRTSLDAAAAVAFGDVTPLAVRVPGACEQACAFCRERAVQDAPRGRKLDPAAQLAEGRRHHSRALFQGDDPLGEPRLAAWIRAAVDLGYEGVTVLTPGARLGDGDTVARLVDAGLDALEVPLYGGDAGTQGAVTRTPGSFARLVAGLVQARRRGVHVVVHTALIPATLPQLAAIAATCERHDLVFERIEALVAQRGQEERYARLAPDLDSVRAAVAAARPALPRPLELRDLPDCVLQPPLADVHVRRVRADGADRLPGTHAPPCATCARRDACPGVSPGYVAAHGDTGLRPY